MHWAPVNKMPPALSDTESNPKQSVQSSKVMEPGRPGTMDGSGQGVVGISEFRRLGKRSSNLSKFREYKE